MTKEMFHVLAAALDLIGKVAAAAKPGALEAIDAMVGQLRKGVDGKVSLESCEDALDDLQEHLDGNDAAADDVLAKRFT